MSGGGPAAGAAPRVLAAVVVPPHLSVSGGARAAEQLSAALRPRCEVTVASMMNGAGSAAAVHRLPVRSWLPPLLPWSRLPPRYRTLFYRSDIPRLLAPGAFDLVHLHNPMPALELERIARACRARGLPYVISTHGFNEVANGGTVYGFGRAGRLLWQQLVVAPVARAVRRAAGIFALSPADADIVAAMGFAGPVTPVPNGVALPGPADAAADRQALARLGIPAGSAPGTLTALFLANHTPNKGLPQLLEAFGRIERPFLLIIGGERRGGIGYDAAIAACRPGQRIVVTGRLSDAEVAAAFRRADLFVFPTLADTLPLVVLEAMAHGLPVVASRVGGIPYQLGGDCGLLVPPGDAGALAAAVEALAADPGRRRQAGAAARRRVADRFTWARAAEQALQGYGEALQGRPRPAAALLPTRPATLPATLPTPLSTTLPAGPADRRAH
ncbi:glycosyltransferase family 4 protein [Paeniroseomonas aquatica]|uniref:Glycosyltransferase n=1 Tax=Paeniroseomonas aquatica TaxID=373043 RepID=A0ABT8AGT6_9PROT|nr:glycosyltransferase [Paeniroseomonas aquatica]MDN3568885.1 glycosyltransferase [Paeniroseomonas aquatica]